MTRLGAVESALGDVYSGAGPDEAQAVIDRLEDLGWVVIEAPPGWPAAAGPVDVPRDEACEVEPAVRFPSHLGVEHPDEDGSYWDCPDDCPACDHGLLYDDLPAPPAVPRPDREALRDAVDALRKIEYLGSQAQTNAAVHMGMIARAALADPAVLAVLSEEAQ